MNKLKNNLSSKNIVLIAFVTLTAGIAASCQPVAASPFLEKPEHDKARVSFLENELKTKSASDRKTFFAGCHWQVNKEQNDIELATPACAEKITGLTNHKLTVTHLVDPIHFLFKDGKMRDCYGQARFYTKQVNGVFNINKAIDHCYTRDEEFKLAYNDMTNFIVTFEVFAQLKKEKPVYWFLDGADKRNYFNGSNRLNEAVFRSSSKNWVVQAFTSQAVQLAEVADYLMVYYGANYDNRMRSTLHKIKK